MLALNVGKMQVSIWTFHRPWIITTENSSLSPLPSRFHSYLLFHCMPVSPFLTSLYIRSRHSTYKNELATVLIVMVSDYFSLFWWSGDNFFFFNHGCASYHFPSYHPHNSPPSLTPGFFTAVVSRSHCSESLVTRANTFLNSSNFSITRLLDSVSAHWKTHYMCVSQHPAGSRSFPSGPKLICCGQIVCKGKKMWVVVWMLRSPSWTTSICLSTPRQLQLSQLGERGY